MKNGSHFGDGRKAMKSGNCGKGVGYATIMLLFVWLLLPAPATAQTQIKLDRVRKKKLDTFFSNFSESAMESFKQHSLSRKALLDFALDHIYKNDYRSIRHAGNNAYIPAALVDKVTEKYFGEKLKKHQESEYQVPEASGEAYVFSQISGLAEVGKNLFRATGVIYSVDSGSTLDPHATPATWKKAGEDVEQTGKFSALVKKEPSGRYILLEYQVDPTSAKTGT